MPVSALQRAKRVLVSVLLSLAAAYGLDLKLAREASDDEVTKAFRRVTRRVHPDKGGAAADAQRLNAARDAWLTATTNSKGRGRPAQASQAPAAAAAALAPACDGFRVRSVAVLLTYQSWLLTDSAATWQRFLQFVEGQVATWNVQHWSATMEQNASGTCHLHLMLQFRSAVDCGTSRFSFEGTRPNASPHDYLGEGWCRKKLQQSINRGMFYVWAEKLGTVRLAAGGLCVAGNYEPCWTKAAMTYQVLGKWPETLWKQRKLSTERYEDYLYLTRDGVLARKRNLDAVREHEEAAAEHAVIEANTARLRSNPELYQPFPLVPEAQACLGTFKEDRLRYPLLVVLGASQTGKTEWVKSLFRKPLELKVGSLQVFPEAMRSFDRRVHDGIILDDVRDIAFLSEQQDKMQGKYDARVEFATTPGGTCAYSKYLFAVPIAVTINKSTRNLDFLDTHDWLKHPSNRVLLNFPDILGQL
ncbi:unnamed protein product [Symbiodinium sp. CCMP2592]|nr:unnamed protein product [Symbiodinium sp. CCMP2592]